MYIESVFVWNVTPDRAVHTSLKISIPIVIPVLTDFVPTIFLRVNTKMEFCTKGVTLMTKSG